MPEMNMILKICGKAYLGALSLSACLCGFLQSLSTCSWLIPNSKAYKHVFTLPSLVEKEPKAMRSGNTGIHGMTSVTPASIAYITTQVRDARALYHS